jgi:hypothetical protein
MLAIIERHQPKIIAEFHPWEQANAISNAVAENAAITGRDGKVRFAEDSAYGQIDASGNAIVEGMTLAFA